MTHDKSHIFYDRTDAMKFQIQVYTLGRSEVVEPH